MIIHFLDSQREPSWVSSVENVRRIFVSFNVGIDDAIEAETQARAICTLKKDYERACLTFVDNPIPESEGTWPEGGPQRGAAARVRRSSIAAQRSSPAGRSTRIRSTPARSSSRIEP